MKFRIGDKVVVNPPSWYGGGIEPNEKCVVTEIECAPHIIWVHNTDGITMAIYENWASIIVKNEQLLFEFME